MRPRSRRRSRVFSPANFQHPRKKEKMGGYGTQNGSFRMSQSLYEGGCLCGAVRFAVRAEPYRVGLCHCLDCRKHSGSLFAALAVFPAEHVTVTGPTADYKGRHFCPRCGSSVFGRGANCRIRGRAWKAVLWSGSAAVSCRCVVQIWRRDLNKMVDIEHRLAALSA